MRTVEDIERDIQEAKKEAAEKLAAKTNAEREYRVANKKIAQLEAEMLQSLRQAMASKGKGK